MITQRNRYLKNRLFALALPLIYVLAGSCGQDLTDDPIPPAFFPNAVINLAFPEYQQSLAVDGGSKQIDKVGSTGVGVRGIILYRKDASTYRAFEVNCSYHPNEASANVGINTSRLFLTCTGCGSNFSFPEGSPSGGVAWRPLRKYRTELNGTNLTITSEIMN